MIKNTEAPKNEQPQDMGRPRRNFNESNNSNTQPRNNNVFQQPKQERKIIEQQPRQIEQPRYEAPRQENNNSFSRPEAPRENNNGGGGRRR